MGKDIIKIKLNTLLIMILILLIAISVLGVFIVINKEDAEQGKIVTQDKANQISQDNLSMEFLKLENNEENIVYSPLSIKYALKMLSEGASGNTKTQIDNLVEKIDLTNYENIEKVLSFANGVYIRDTYSKYVKESSRDTLIKKYNAEINYDSFEDAKNINTWIERKTLGIIKNMLKDEVVQHPNCEMLLINALAIDMAWDIKFDTNNTYGKTFYLKDGTKMTATTMNMETKSDKVLYYKDKNITALTIDLQKYKDTQLEFMAIMPESNLSEYVEKVTIDEIEDITQKLTSASKTKYGVDISIPKFSFDYDLKLKDDLIRLGVTDAFIEKVADFSNISEIRSLYVEDALHKADIKFSEDGIKAAAVTVMVMYDKGMVAEPTIPEEINIDKPFLFLIRDKKTKEIWFVGTVYEPNLWENEKVEYQKY